MRVNSRPGVRVLVYQLTRIVLGTTRPIPCISVVWSYFVNTSGLLIGRFSIMQANRNESNTCNGLCFLHRLLKIRLTLVCLFIYFFKKYLRWIDQSKWTQNSKTRNLDITRWNITYININNDFILCEYYIWFKTIFFGMLHITKLQNTVANSIVKHNTRNYTKTTKWIRFPKQKWIILRICFLLFGILNHKTKKCGTKFKNHVFRFSIILVTMEINLILKC